MNTPYVAMNKHTGVSLGRTLGYTFAEACAKAVELGLNMNAYVICKA